jgi:hypothetical protein
MNEQIGKIPKPRITKCDYHWRIRIGEISWWAISWAEALNVLGELYRRKLGGL